MTGEVEDEIDTHILQLPLRPWGPSYYVVAYLVDQIRHGKAAITVPTLIRQYLLGEPYPQLLVRTADPGSVLATFFL